MKAIERLRSLSPPGLGLGTGAGGALVRSTWLRRHLLDPEPPSVALEVRPRSLGLVRLVRQGRRYAVGSAGSLDLPDGVVSVSMVQPNVTDAAAFRQTVLTLLERAGVIDGARIALVLPDAVARVALVPAADLAAKGRGVLDEMIRFRLRKVVPFEVRDAQISTTPAGSGPGTPQVLVGAICRPVLESYEEACRSVGLEPGQVELSGLTLLDAVRRTGGGSGDRLLVNWDEGYVTFVLLRGGAPALIRLLTGAAAEPDNVAREAVQTAVYYKERLGGGGLAGMDLRSAALPYEIAASLLAGALGFDPRPIDPWAPLSAVGTPAATQVLAGAAACVARRAA